MLRSEQQIPEQMAGIAGSILQGWRTADTGANGGHCRLRTAGLVPALTVSISGQINQGAQNPTATSA